MSHSKPLYLFELLMAVPLQAATFYQWTQPLLTTLHYALVLVSPSQALSLPILGCAPSIIPIEIPILI
jgi:hypothetical protein